MNAMSGALRLHPDSSGRLVTLMRYFLVGAASSLMDYGLFAVLNAVLGIPAAFANVTSYASSSAVNFLMHRRWTFQTREQQSAPRQLAQYALLVAFSLLANTWLVTLFVPLAGTLIADAVSASVAAKTAAAALLWSVNLVSSNRIVFRGR